MLDLKTPAIIRKPTNLHSIGTVSINLSLSNKLTLFQVTVSILAEADGQVAI